MTGIAELFADLQEEAHYHCTAQLELWGWQRRANLREIRRGYFRRRRSDAERAESLRALNREAAKRFANKVKADPARLAERNRYRRELYARKRAA